VTEDDPPFFDGVDVEFLDGQLVVERTVMPRWIQPGNEWRSGETVYDVYGFNGPTVQDSGRKRFQVFVRPRANPVDPAPPPAEPSPA
jgi:hypothetical protein